MRNSMTKNILHLGICQEAVSIKNLGELREEAYLHFGWINYQ